MGNKQQSLSINQLQTEYMEVASRAINYSNQATISSIDSPIESRSSMNKLSSSDCFSQNKDKEKEKMMLKKCENELNILVSYDMFSQSLEKLFEIKKLQKIVFGKNTDHYSYTLHRCSSIFYQLGRFEEALRYEIDSCNIRKMLSLSRGYDQIVVKGLIYISKLQWHLKQYTQGFYSILDAHKILENFQQIPNELRTIIAFTSQEMFELSHDLGNYFLAFQLKIISFQSKRAAFMQEEGLFDENLFEISQDLWKYKEGISLLYLIPSKNYQNPTNKMQSMKPKQILEQENDSCAICFREFQLNDRIKQLSCVHYFHDKCIDRWIVTNQKCPVCRKSQVFNDYCKKYNFPKVNRRIFEFLKKEANDENRDQFMHDYTHYFNIFSLNSSYFKHPMHENQMERDECSIGQSDNLSNHLDKQKESTLVRNKKILYLCSALEGSMINNCASSDSEKHTYEDLMIMGSSYIHTSYFQQEEKQVTLQTEIQEDEQANFRDNEICEVKSSENLFPAEYKTNKQCMNYLNKQNERIQYEKQFQHKKEDLKLNKENKHPLLLLNKNG